MRILVKLGKTLNDGDVMTLTIPRRALGLPNDSFRFEFKFVDSTEPCRAPFDWYDHGVVEPLGRVAFVYSGNDN